MITGNTQSGFKFKIDKRALNDWEILQWISEGMNGEDFKLVMAIKKMLGEEQYLSLLDHVRDDDGYVDSEKIASEIAEILEGDTTVKK